jgi:predicted TIM-barrel fold metal-dependent hydrolase
MRDRAPRFEFTETHRIWIAEGKPAASERLSLQARAAGTRVAEDVELRLRELDADGIWAETILGNLGLYCLRFEDPAFAIACARVYNDYVAEAFAPYAERQVPIALIPVLDVDAAVAEIERVARLQLRGIAMPMVPPTPYFHERYDRLWAAAQANGLPISFHFDAVYFDNEGLRVPGAAFDSAALRSSRATRVKLTSLPNLMTVVPQHLVSTLVGGGILAAYPDLQIVCVEANAGWLAPLMEAMDYAWADTATMNRSDSRQAAYYSTRWPHPLQPSDYVRRQVKVTFQDEPAPLAFLHLTGPDPLMWGSDFPHPEGTWPHSREVTDRLFAGVAAEAREAILGGNLARLYAIPPPRGVE